MRFFVRRIGSQEFSCNTLSAVLVVAALHRFHLKQGSTFMRLYIFALHDGRKKHDPNQAFVFHRLASSIWHKLLTLPTARSILGAVHEVCALLIVSSGHASDGRITKTGDSSALRSAQGPCNVQ